MSDQILSETEQFVQTELNKQKAESAAREILRQYKILDEMGYTWEDELKIRIEDPDRITFIEIRVDWEVKRS